MSCRAVSSPSFVWRDALVTGIVVAALVGAYSQWPLLSLPQRWLIGGLFAAVLGFLTRTLLGPILLYNLMRTARRGRYILLRCTYAAVMLAILWAVYLQFEERYNVAGTPALLRYTQSRAYVAPFMIQDQRAARLAELARFAEAFFSTFICIQLGAVLLLTPAYTAGAIADEKDRKTLEFLFATDLANREIVLSKLLACMANVGMLVLTGLPILALMQLLGGVDPNLVIAGYVATGLTILSLASVSMLVSVYSHKARDAIVLSYLCLLAYIMLSFVAAAGVAPLRRPPASWEEIVWAAVLEQFAAGNLFVMLGELKTAWDAGTALTSILPGLVERYALFHGLLAAVAIVWSVRRLRVVGLRPRRAKLKKERVVRSWHWFRPHLGRQPMLWKEIYAEPGMAFNLFGKAIVGIIILVSFVPPLWVAIVLLWGNPFVAGTVVRGTVVTAPTWAEIARFINGWVRVVGTTVACLTLLGVAVRAAGSITGERDRDTLDNLLTTPLTARQILYAKWIGSVLSVRSAWIWLTLVWSVGVLLGGLDLATLPWLLLLWLVYATFFALLGQRFSLTRSTTLKATLVTLASLAVLTLGHWLPRFFLEEPKSYFHQMNEWDYVLTFQQFGLTPPLALGWFAFHGNDVTSDPFGAGSDWQDPLAVLIAIALGLVAWGTAAAFLWRGNQARFAAATSRQPDHSFRAATAVQDGWGP